MLSFKPTFSLSSFTFIRRLFSSSLLSAVKVVSSAYLSLLIFLLAVLIPACASQFTSLEHIYRCMQPSPQSALEYFHHLRRKPCHPLASPSPHLPISSIPSMCMCVLVLIPHCLDSLCIIIHFHFLKCESSYFILLL